jgi:hypothetical protein
MHDALPNASFIGFTGTPIESGDKNTQAVFGDYIPKDQNGSTDPLGNSTLHPGPPHE